jgi:glycerophosphoryl diester phosphodiesterase
LRGYDAGGWFGPEFAGERIPTLEEALALAVELDLAINIEIKAERGHASATAAAVAAVLDGFAGRLPPVLVSSFLRPVLAAMRDLAPKIPRGLLLRTVPLRWRSIAARVACASVNVDHRRLSPRLAADIRKAGYPLLAYTVNDPERARTLFEWGVTSVFSDVPDIILAAGSIEPPVRQSAAGAASSLAMRQGANW